MLCIEFATSATSARFKMSRDGPESRDERRVSSSARGWTITGIENRKEWETVRLDGL